MFKTAFIKTFHQVEPQLLRGLVAGLIIAERPVAYDADSGAYGVATVAVDGHKFIENGIICSLDAEGKIVNYVSGKAAFIHYDEELNADFDAKNMFAVEAEGENTYIRLIQLFPGDEFMTDNVAGDLVAGTVYGVKDGVIDASVTTGGQFLYEEGSAFETTLPNGEAGYHFVFLG